MAEHSCGHEQAEQNNTHTHHQQDSSCHPKKGRPDFLLWGVTVICGIFLCALRRFS